MSANFIDFERVMKFVMMEYEFIEDRGEDTLTLWLHGALEQKRSMTTRTLGESGRMELVQRFFNGLYAVQPLGVDFSLTDLNWKGKFLEYAKKFGISVPDINFNLSGASHEPYHTAYTTVDGESFSVKKRTKPEAEREIFRLIFKYYADKTPL